MVGSIDQTRATRLFNNQYRAAIAHEAAASRASRPKRKVLGPPPEAETMPTRDVFGNGAERNTRHAVGNGGAGLVMI